MTQRWDDTLFQPVQWYPPRRRLRRPARLGHEPLSRPRRVLQQLRPLRRDDRRAGWLDRQRHRGAAERAGGPHSRRRANDTDARPRFRRPTITIVGEDESGPGQRDRTRAIGSKWQFHADMVNDFAWATAQNFVWAGDPGHHPGQGPDSDSYALPAEETLPPTPRRGRSRGTRSSSTRSSGAPYPFPQLTPSRTAPTPGMEYPMVINIQPGRRRSRDRPPVVADGR